MTRNNKLTALFAILVVGFLSIYANVMVFNTGNSTSSSLTFTLGMQSGAQVPVTVAPGQNVPTQLNGDAVVGASLFGAYIPGGVNAIVAGPNGPVQVVWQSAGCQNGGLQGMPSTTEQD